MFGKKVKDVELEGTVAANEETQDTKESETKKGSGVMGSVKKHGPKVLKVAALAGVALAGYVLGSKNSGDSDESAVDLLPEPQDDNVINVDFTEETVD